MISLQVYQFPPSLEMMRMVSNTFEVELEEADVEENWVEDFMVEQDADIGE